MAGLQIGAGGEWIAQLVDRADKESPTAYTLTLSGGVLVLDAIDDNYLWVAEGNNDGPDRMRVIDWSNPAALSVVATVDLTDSSTYVTAAHVFGNRYGLGAGTQAGADNNDFMFVDLADPTSPIVLERFSVGRTQWARFMDETYACGDNSGGSVGLEIVDWSAVPGGGSAVRTGYIDTSILGSGGGCVSPDTNIVASLVSGDQLAIFDASNKTSPSFVTNYSTSGDGGHSAAGEFIDNRHLVLASGSTGLLVYDLINPASPALVATVGLAGSVGSIAKPDGSTDYVYVGFTNGGLAKLNLSNPTAPVVVWQHVDEQVSSRARHSAARGIKVAFPYGAGIVVWKVR